MGLVFPVIGSLANIRDFLSTVHQGSRHLLRGGTLEPGGTGPYAPASYLTHPSLPGHTIFAPDLRALRDRDEYEDEDGKDENGERRRRTRRRRIRLPVLVWANGMGLAWGLMFGAFLREIASHGYIVVASGPPCDREGWWWRRLRRVDERAMVDAVRWAVAATGDWDGEEEEGAEDEGKRWDVRAHVDGTRIALAGQSRGGMDAYAAAAAATLLLPPPPPPLLLWDERGGDQARGERGARAALRMVCLFNGGLFARAAAARAAQVRRLAVPVVYVAGGAADVGRRAAERDWAELLPGDLPAWMGTLEGVGHGGTFWEEEEGKDDGGGGGGKGRGGGRFVDVALDWLAWLLKEDEGARERLLGGYYEREGWAVKARNW